MNATSGDADTMGGSMPVVRVSQQLLLHASCARIATAVSACQLFLYRNRYACVLAVRLFLRSSCSCIATTTYACQLSVYRIIYLCMPAARVSQQLDPHASCACITTAL
eukprot:2979141-Pyramimonas_sp.AAC.1